MIELIAPAATVLVGILGLIGVLATLVQRSRDAASKRRFDRLSWALNAALSKEERTRVAGELVLREIARDSRYDDDDRRVIATVLRALPLPDGPIDD